LFLRLSYKSYPVAFLAEHYWCFKVPQDLIPDFLDAHGPPVELSSRDIHLHRFQSDFAFFRIVPPNASRKVKLTGPGVKKDIKDGLLTSPFPELLHGLYGGNIDSLEGNLWRCAEELKQLGKENDWGVQLDWSDELRTSSHRSCG
jgi:DNA polymerase gamma 1